ncbi:MAG: ankyrin repeat domain-containing protein [Alphaproteobacteria bacterium]|nr:ankyrin repeat domain-containing protein [Alphaproteobacteria bacterium]
MANNRLFHCVKRAKALKTVPALIELGVNPHETDDKGRTLLHYAAEQGHLPLVDYLVNTVKIHPNIQDHDGQTAMHMAATQHRVAIVKTLSAAGGDVNATDKVGLRPLHMAAIYGHITMASTLVDKGADIFATSYAAGGHGNLTAREAALLANQPKMAQVLGAIERIAKLKLAKQQEASQSLPPEPVFICSHDDVNTPMKTKENQKS